MENTIFIRDLEYCPNPVPHKALQSFLYNPEITVLFLFNKSSISLRKREEGY